MTPVPETRNAARVVAGICIAALFCCMAISLPAAADDDSAPPPDLWQSVMAAIRSLLGMGPAVENGTTGASGGVPVLQPVADRKISAGYWYLYPDPNDDTYSLVMTAQDRIPWTKINRLYIGFATVKDGVLTDMPAGNSAADSAHREEMQRRIHQIVSLCRQNSPDTEIFIVSNFGQDIDPEYLAAAEDPEKFADSVLSYLKEYDLDGYDMDWESGSIDEYAPRLTLLLSACHTTFGAAGSTPRGGSYLVTHTVWPGVESPATVAGLRDSVD